MFTCTKCKRIICKDEEIFMLGRKWHKQCWSCGIWYGLEINGLCWLSCLLSCVDSCSMPLNYGAVEEIMGQLNCNNCYLKKHGPRNVGVFMAKWNRESYNQVSNRYCLSSYFGHKSNRKQILNFYPIGTKLKKRNYFIRLRLLANFRMVYSKWCRLQFKINDSLF